jgi:hypothetical protein
MEQLDERPPEFNVTASLNDTPELTATKLRAALGVDTESQSRWRIDNEAFRQWRGLAERAGVLTFQATGIDLAEAGGFSISLRPLPAAVVNIKDAYRGPFRQIKDCKGTFTRRGEPAQLTEGGIVKASLPRANLISFYADLLGRRFGCKTSGLSRPLKQSRVRDTPEVVALSYFR